MRQEIFNTFEDAIFYIQKKDKEYKGVWHSFKAKEKTFRMHFHPKAAEWLILLKGRYEIKIGKIEQKISCKKRKVTVVKVLPCKPHTLKAVTDILYYVVRDRDDETIYC